MDEAELATLDYEHHCSISLKNRIKPTFHHSYTECMECGDEIPEARRVALPGVQLCVYCQGDKEYGRNYLK